MIYFFPHKSIMSGSVTDSDACGTDWEKWIPQNGKIYPNSL